MKSLLQLGAVLIALGTGAFARATAVPDVSNLLLVIFTSSISTGGTIGLSWTVPTENVGGGEILVPLNYNVYRSHAGQAYTQIRTNIKTTQIAVIGELAAGAKECFSISVVENGQESARSQENCVTLPK